MSIDPTGKLTRAELLAKWSAEASEKNFDDWLVSELGRLRMALTDIARECDIKGLKIMPWRRAKDALDGL